RYFQVIYQKIVGYLNSCQELWIRDAYACADHRYRLNIRVVNEKPWMNLFVHHMFLRPQEEEMEHFEPAWRILSAPGLRLDPAECGVCGHHAIVISFSHRMILVAGTAYTGEIKK